MHAKRIAEAFEQLSSEELTLLQKTLRNNDEKRRSIIRNPPRYSYDK